MTTKQSHYNWIQNIIDSCEHDFHFECVDKLIQLYHQRYNDDATFFELKKERDEHWNTTHAIIH
jgi:hypothetical protein